MPVRVVVVEDDSVVADAIAEGLRDQGMAVDVADDGPTGLDKATVNSYEVTVLNRDLPGLHGDDLCRRIVDSPSTSRILMLTAADLVEDRVEGLSLGADDYPATLRGTMWFVSASICRWARAVRPGWIARASSSAPPPAAATASSGRAGRLSWRTRGQCVEAHDHPHRGRLPRSVRT
jgi:CheY-like chemotaxis protein